MYKTQTGIKNCIPVMMAVVLIAVFVLFLSTSTALASDGTIPEKTEFNSTVAYKITTAVSFFLLASYCAFIKKKDIVFIFLFASVLLVNLGYYFLSSSSTISEALLANDITYFGAVFLPLFMLIIIMDECYYKRNKIFLSALLCINIGVLLLTLSPGNSTLYYEDVSLDFVNGGAVLVKSYGPLHCVYAFFLAFYFAAMIFVIIYARFRKSKSSPKLAVSLLAVVFTNILIWFIEQKIYIHFEFLSISYIVTEVYLLSLYSMLDTFYGKKPEPIIAETVHESTDAVPVCPEDADRLIQLLSDSYQLTARELEVCKKLLINEKRKEIAEDLCVSENTVKKHTSNIFAKLEVSSRAEIIEKLSQLK